MVLDRGAATYSCVRCSLAAGAWLGPVWARQSGSSAVYESWTQKSFVLSASGAAACTSVSLNPNVASPQAAGGDVIRSEERRVGKDGRPTITWTPSETRSPAQNQYVNL